MRFGISQAPAARQCQIKRAVDCFGAEIAEDDALRGAQRATQAIFQIMPEAHRGGVRAAPFTFEGFDLVVGVGVAGIESGAKHQDRRRSRRQDRRLCQPPWRLRPRASPRAAISSTQ